MSCDYCWPGNCCGGPNCQAAPPASTERPLNLDELGSLLLRRDKVPYGFFLSQALWDAISARFAKEGGGALAATPQIFHGIRMALDPSLSATEFNVALTESAWIKRLCELRAHAYLLMQERPESEN